VSRRFYLRITSWRGIAAVRPAHTDDYAGETCDCRLGLMPPCNPSLPPCPRCFSVRCLCLCPSPPADCIQLLFPAADGPGVLPPRPSADQRWHQNRRVQHRWRPPAWACAAAEAVVTPAAAAAAAAVAAAAWSHERPPRPRITDQGLPQDYGCRGCAIRHGPRTVAQDQDANRAPPSTQGHGDHGSMGHGGLQVMHACATGGTTCPSSGRCQAAHTPGLRVLPCQGLNHGRKPQYYCHHQALHLARSHRACLWADRTTSYHNNTYR
jgi:hypothetical protein